ncbi:DUF397 domain-containing protein [Streptomyces sp. NPDC047000]|uniref:DUF397 domain-containing protein n=1 Tax=Streptomyces sp. NPDC047000 TaxID=3155474 RepID=UPI0033F46E09
MKTTEVGWFKSSYSGGGGGNCVEIAVASHAIHIRDSKDKERGRLTVSPDTWSAFTALAAADLPF